MNKDQKGYAARWRIPELRPITSSGRPRVLLIDASDQVAEIVQEIAPAMPIGIHRGDAGRATLSSMMRDADIVLV